jgi:hypothetical protein
MRRTKHTTLVDVAYNRAFSGIITWQPHGRGFVILDRKRLEMEVLPLWFTQTKIESFFKQVGDTVALLAVSQ